MKEYKLSVTPLKYLEYVRNYRYCIVCLKNTLVEPHHLKAVGMGNNRKNELKEHYTAIPVCRICHLEYHSKGEKYQSNKYAMNHWKENAKILSEFLVKELEKQNDNL